MALDICGGEGVYLPESNCNDCEQFAERLHDVEDSLENLIPRVEALEEQCETLAPGIEKILQLLGNAEEIIYKKTDTDGTIVAHLIGWVEEFPNPPDDPPEYDENVIFVGGAATLSGGEEYNLTKVGEGLMQGAYIYALFKDYELHDVGYEAQEFIAEGAYYSGEPSVLYECTGNTCFSDLFLIYSEDSGEAKLIRTGNRTISFSSVTVGIIPT